MNWAQLRAMLWLRWRLTRNQWRRSGQINAVITLVLVTLALSAGAMGGLGGIVGGAFGLSRAQPHVSLIVWDVLTAMFFSFWIVGVVTDLQRSEMLHLGQLLTLPVSLRGVFLLNFLASHLSVSIAVVLPTMLGLGLGLVIGGGFRYLLMFPLVLAFFFMVTAWTYCLRGWLASLMVNKRRRRAIVVGVTFAFIILAQMPNIVMNVWGHGQYTKVAKIETKEDAERWKEESQREQRETKETVLTVHRCVPPLWLSYGARGLVVDNAWPAVAGTLGMCVIGLWGLAHAYHSTIRFYRGGKTSKGAQAPAAPRKAAVRASAGVGRKGRMLVERRPPWAPEEAGALAVATLRSMLRAPEVKMAMATNVLIIVFVSMPLLLHKVSGVPDRFKPLVASAAAGLTMMGLGQLLFNHFGFDRAGFRALVLLPTPRRHVVLGKNLAVLPVAAAVFLIYLGLATALAHLRVWDLLAGVIEFLGAFLTVSTLGNVASILVPYRVAAGSMKPTKTSALTGVFIFVAQMCLPIALAPVFLPAVLALLADGLLGLSGAAVALVSASVFAGLAALLYWKTLGPLGDLLLRREKRILEVVTREVE